MIVSKAISDYQAFFLQMTFICNKTSLLLACLNSCRVTISGCSVSIVESICGARLPPPSHFSYVVKEKQDCFYYFVLNQAEKNIHHSILSCA